MSLGTQQGVIKEQFLLSIDGLQENTIKLAEILEIKYIMHL